MPIRIRMLRAFEWLTYAAATAVPVPCIDSWSGLTSDVNVGSDDFGRPSAVLGIVKVSTSELAAGVVGSSVGVAGGAVVGVVEVLGPVAAVFFAAGLPTSANPTPAAASTTRIGSPHSSTLAPPDIFFFGGICPVIDGS